MSWTKPLTGFRRVGTNRGDTLQAIAARELGDAAAWHDLATLNNLRPPYLTDDPERVGPGVLATGSEIMVPAPPPRASGVAADAANDVFGTDIALVGGRLVGDGKGGLQIARGTANLRQAIRHRIDTRPGELLFHPAYGCEVHRLVGERADEVTNRLAAYFVDRALRQDPRIARTEGTTATVAGDAVRVEATAVTVDGKRVRVD